MMREQRQRAEAAARSTASGLGLSVDDVSVLHDSNKLTLRLQPADVVARVAPASPMARQVAQFEIDVAQQLVDRGSPVAVPEPRVGAGVYEHDGFLITLWTHYTSAPGEVPPADYAEALRRLHAGMRDLTCATTHFTDRVEQAVRLVLDPELSPALGEADREFLAGTLQNLRRSIVDRAAGEQILHGEPHPGNVLATAKGPLFVDFETCCRGPVEFDLAHAPEEVGAHYPGLDRALLHECRMLAQAIVTAWRWDRDDRLPHGRQRGVEGLQQLRTALTPE